MAPPGHDRVVVVTGANRAIGHRLAEVLVDDGYRFVGLDVEGEHLGALRDAHPQQVSYHACGVTSDDDVEAAVAGVLDVWDRIDVLVNNAGIATFAPFDDQPPEQARREFEVDYFGLRRTVRAVLPHMVRRAGASSTT